METKCSRLSLSIIVVFKDALSAGETYDRMTKFIAKGYKAIDARIAQLPSNRISDFPGSSRYELCENDSEIALADYEIIGSIEVYGEGDWAKEHVAKEVKALFVEEFQKLVDEFGAASVCVTGVKVIKEVVTKVTETLNV